MLREKCECCNKSRGLTLKTWSSIYVRKDGTKVPTQRQLCEGCYERQETVRKELEAHKANADRIEEAPLNGVRPFQILK